GCSCRSTTTRSRLATSCSSSPVRTSRRTWPTCSAASWPTCSAASWPTCSAASRPSAPLAPELCPGMPLPPAARAGPGGDPENHCGQLPPRIGGVTVRNDLARLAARPKRGKCGDMGYGPGSHHRGRAGRGTPARAGNAGPGGERRPGRGTPERAGDAGPGGGRRSGRGTPERAGDDGRLAGLGELRAAVEGVDVTPVAALLLLRLCRLRLLLSKSLHRLRRQPQLEQVARRHRVLATGHHDVAEHVLEHVGVTAARRRRPAEQAAQEPARTVHADEPHGAHPRPGIARLGRHFGVQRDAEQSVRLTAATAGRLDLRSDLGAYVVP